MLKSTSVDRSMKSQAHKNCPKSIPTWTLSIVQQFPVATIVSTVANLEYHAYPLAFWMIYISPSNWYTYFKSTTNPRFPRQKDLFGAVARIFPAVRPGQQIFG